MGIPVIHNVFLSTRSQIHRTCEKDAYTEFLPNEKKKIGYYEDGYP